MKIIVYHMIQHLKYLTILHKNLTCIHQQCKTFLYMHTIKSHRINICGDILKLRVPIIARVNYKYLWRYHKFEYYGQLKYYINAVSNLSKIRFV